ncbi:MAG: SprT-like domain-containing protein [Christensenella sp.]|uniref:SprT-like domain-containing protein n=1 Tax=Christensenella sp. TaxID=1935934 RepID=UPI002B1ECEB9|nr:SprT-like domain-containing protein [Christensenella sp.]MEA5002752.1 SprT-like domain-containing protein [Christensenella sp.]
MERKTLTPTIDTLHRIFDLFNAHYFEDKLLSPVITVAPDSHNRAYGWCTSWQAWKDTEDNGYYEINVCADYLMRPIEETCGTMLHEMCHLLNLMLDIQDTSRSGTYHNGKFKETAEGHGLHVRKDSTYGYCRTTLTTESLDLLADTHFDFGLYRPKVGTAATTGRDEDSKISDEDTPQKRKSSTRRYQCPICGTIIRATKDVNVICGDCMEPMVLID